GGGTLTGLNTVSTWALGGAPSYTDTVSGRSLAITGFGTLQGGTAADTFNVTANNAFALKGGAGADVFDIAAAATLTGSLDGEAGSDTLQGTGIVNVVLTAAGGTDGFNGTTANITGTPGFSNIDVITGAGGGTLTGLNKVSTWALGGAPSYTDTVSGRSLAITGFGTLQGGTAADTFNVTANNAFALKGGAGADVFDIAAAATLTGSLDGEAGSDTLQGTGIVNVVLTAAGGTDGFNGTTANITGTPGFSNIDVITGA